MTLVRSKNGYYSAIPSLIDGLLSRNLSDLDGSNYSRTGSTVPAVNISEDENGFIIEFAVPGMKKEDFIVKVENDTLTVGSEKNKEVENNVNYRKREFAYQSFNRTFTLPESMVDTDKIAAKYENGILRLMLPKKEEAKPKPAREIKIG